MSNKRQNNQVQQQQSEIYKQSQDLNQTQKEIQFFVYQDLENVLCLLSELEQTNKTLEDQKDHPYMPIATNKAILQVNLSNGIHVDQYYQHNQKQHGKFLKECQDKAKKIFEEIIQQSEIFELDEIEQEGKKVKKVKNPKIQEMCEFYLEKNLKAEKNFNQLPQVPVQIKSEFNQEVIQDVINGMNKVDKQLKNVNNYNAPSIDQIKEKLKQRKEYCNQQLRKNFSIVKKDEIEMELENNNNEHQNKQVDHVEQQEIQNTKVTDGLKFQNAEENKNNEDDQVLKDTKQNNQEKNDMQVEESLQDTNKSKKDDNIEQEKGKEDTKTNSKDKIQMAQQNEKIQGDNDNVEYDQEDKKIK